MKTIRTMVAVTAFVCLPLVSRANGPQTTCTTKAKIAVDGTIHIHRVCTTEGSRTPAPSAPRK